MVNSGLNKTIKKDTIKSIVLRVPPKLQGAAYCYGRIGSGKTVSLLSYAGMYHDNPNRKYKIFDLWGGDRNEHLYWTLPSNKEKYWQYIKKVLRLKDYGPKQYKVNLIYPVTDKLPKKLPQNVPYVYSKLATIPITEVDLDDVSLIIGTPSDTSQGAWMNVKHKIKKNISVSQFLQDYRKEGGEKHLLYNNSLFPLARMGLLQSNGCPYNMDKEFFRKEIDDQETITVLCLDFIEKEYRFFILGYFLKMINSELDRRQRHCIGILREASEFFRVTDQSVVHPRYKILKQMLSQWIRMGRRGFHLLLDTQSPNETKGLVDGQQDLTLLGRLPSRADRELATEQLKKDGFITSKQIAKLGANDPGQFLVCPTAKHSFFAYFLLPRCSFWEEKNGNFYKNIWPIRVGDKWVSFKDEIDKLLEKFKLEEKEIRENEKPRKRKAADELSMENTFINEDNLEDSSIDTMEIVTIKPTKKKEVVKKFVDNPFEDMEL